MNGEAPVNARERVGERFELGEAFDVVFQCLAPCARPSGGNRIRDDDDDRLRRRWFNIVMVGADREKDGILLAVIAQKVHACERAEAALWSADPYVPVINDGWLTGRGAGDMKGGLAMGLLAVAALRRRMPEAITGELASLSVIEEECTGNGTLAAARAGVLGDAVVLLEPTDLGSAARRRRHLWMEIILPGFRRSRRGGGPRREPGRAACRSSWRRWPSFESQMRVAAPDPEFGVSPYNVNVGTVRAGDWPSSVPGQRSAGRQGRVSARVDSGEALGRISAAVAGAAADPVLSQYPPVIRQAGFRAEGFLLPADHPLADCDGQRARRRARSAAAPVRARRDHGRAVLPQPVRRAGAGLRASEPATSTPPTKRSSSPA